MKKILKEISAIILIIIHKVFIQKHKGILSIYFHNPSKEVFENVLIWLKKHKYSFVSLDELYDLIEKKSTQLEKLVSITFDDGWNKNLELIDLINKYKVPIAIFIPTEAVLEGNYWFEYGGIKGQQVFTGIEKKEHFKSLPGSIFKEKVKLLKANYRLIRNCITLNELREISKNKLVTIGSHTVTHPILNMLTLEEQKKELFESKQLLRNWLSVDIDYLAYPNGDFDAITIDMAKKCGYKLGFSTTLGTINTHNVNRYTIPRHAIDDNGGYYESISKILGVWQKIYYKGTILFKLIN